MTINSEDLTAKEFASIAGIQILPEEEEEELEERRISDEDDISILHTISSFDVGNSVLSRTSRDSSRPTRIWDHEFWQRPYYHREQEDLPILNEFRSENASMYENTKILFLSFLIVHDERYISEIRWFNNKKGIVSIKGEKPLNMKIYLFVIGVIRVSFIQCGAFESYPIPSFCWLLIN
ncbi:hypothetical protein K501DRAFT_337705 [Backusella circina FSU 941]|nr:hypothetical protein K501DRAFT_337705 [Backusella circina FSU 941]